MRFRKVAWPVAVALIPTRLEATLQQLDLIVIDELSYLPIDRDGVESLFGCFSRCQEQTSVIVTANLPCAGWPATFAGDERMTGAWLERLPPPAISRSGSPTENRTTPRDLYDAQQNRITEKQRDQTGAGGYAPDRLLR